MWLAVRKRSGLAGIGSCNSTISPHARFACAVNLQNVYELLKEAWTFSIALDMFTRMSPSYLDVGLRVHLNKLCVINLHILAIPMHDSHTAVVIFDTTKNLLMSCLCSGEPSSLKYRTTATENCLAVSLEWRRDSKKVPSPSLFVSGTALINLTSASSPYTGTSAAKSSIGSSRH